MKRNRSLNVVPDPEAAIADVIADLPGLSTTKDAASVLGISYRTLQRWIDRDLLTVGRTSKGKGGRILVPRTEIERLLRVIFGV